MTLRTVLRPMGAIALGVIVLASALGVHAARAADLHVGVVSNFTEAGKEIAAAFEAKTHTHVALSFGSSGQLYDQASKGGPLEILLSADAARPAQAEKAGFAVAGTRFTYAIGKLVLFSPKAGLVDDKGAVLRSAKFYKLAVPDPAVTAYGAAAVQAMTRLGVHDALKPKLVHAGTTLEAYQLVKAGKAEVGFVALSQLTGETGGSRWLVPQAVYAPIEQQAVLLKTGKDDPAAKAFLAFLEGPEAVAIIKRYGYGVP